MILKVLYQNSLLFIVKNYSYNGGYIYAFYEQRIDIILVKDKFTAEGTVVDAAQCKVRSIETSLKIQGAPMSKYQFADKYQMVVFETPDN